MKKTCRLALALLLVVSQVFLFLLPCSAETAGGEYLTTDVREDFPGTDLDSEYPVIELAGCKPDVESGEILSAAVADDPEFVNLFLYIYFHAGVPADASGYRLHLSSDAGDAFYAGTIVSATETVAKLRFRIPQSEASSRYISYTLSNGKRIGHLDLLLRNLYVDAAAGVRVLAKTIDGGTAYSASIRMRFFRFSVDAEALDPRPDFSLPSSPGGSGGTDDPFGDTLVPYMLAASDTDNPRSGELVSFVVEEQLALDVGLSAERFSTSESDEGKYLQVNTAIFLLPTDYFVKFGDLDSIEYAYTLYKDVPMLVTQDKSFYDLVHTYSDYESFYQAERPGIATASFYERSMMADTFVASTVPFVGITYGARALYRLNSALVFYAESINTSSNNYAPDVSEEELYAAYAQLKENYLQYKMHYSGRDGYSFMSFETFLHAGSREPYTFDTKYATDSFSSASFAETASWFQKFNGFLTNQIYKDDGFEKLERFQIFEASELAGKTTDELSSLLKIDTSGAGELAAKLLNPFRQDMTVVAFHYLETDYSAWRTTRYVKPEHDDGSLLHFESETVDFNDGDNDKTYLCLNAIIDDFEIIKLAFNDGERIIEIYTDMIPMIFIAVPESPDRVEDSFTKPVLDIEFPDVSRIWSIIKATVITVVIVFAVYWILKLIGVFRNAFGGRRK